MLAHPEKNGRLMVGLDNGLNFLFDEEETQITHRLPFNPLQDRKLLESLEKEDSGIQFSHTLEEQIRGQLKAGFTLLDLYENTNGSGPSPRIWRAYILVHFVREVMPL